MKKIYKYILVAVLMLFGINEEVNAASSGVNSCVDSGACTLLCQYNYDNGNQYNIYFDNNSLLYKFSFGNNTLVAINRDTSGYAFIDPAAETELISGKCPSNLYYGKKGAISKVCFDNYQSSNGNHQNGYCMSNKDLGGIFKNGKDNGEEPKNVFKEEVLSKTNFNISTKVPIASCLKKGSCNALCYYENNNKTEGILLYSNPTVGYNGSYFYSAMEIYNTTNTNYFDGSMEKLKNDLECPFVEKMEGVNYYRFYFGDNKNNDYNIYNIDGKFKEEYLKKRTEKEESFYDCDGVKEKLKSNIVNYDTAEVCGFNYEILDSPTTKLKQIFIINDNKKFKFYEARLDSNNKIFLEESKDEIEDISYEDSFTCSMYDAIYRKELILNIGNYKLDKYNKNKLVVADTYNRFCSTGIKGGMVFEEIPDINDCESLLGVDLVNEINSWLLYIKIAVPIIIIVMGSLDFGKAFISSDEEAMKKAQKRFIMRLIIGMVIFFIPAIVNALLNIANQVWGGFNGTCGVTF